MPKKYRLSRSDFARIRKERSSRLSGEYTSLAAFQLPHGMQGPRAACVVSKKAVQKANARNLIERRIRGSLLPLLKGSREPIAYIFHAKSSAKDASYEELRNETVMLFERARSRYTIG